MLLGVVKASGRAEDLNYLRLIKSRSAAQRQKSVSRRKFAVLQEEERAVTGDQSYVPQEPLKHQHISGHMTNPARAGHFRKGRA
ncbi:hypothetical protein FHX06_005478 [Rhizobium sp. BK512]|nr:hypothetical protein [Rhizobium sp. BK512]